MVYKFKSKLPLLFLFLFVFTATPALAGEEQQQPEPQQLYRHCEQVCEKQGEGPWKCTQHCDTNNNRIQKQEMQRGSSPQEHSRHCEQICEKQGQGPWKCTQHCDTNKIQKQEMKQSSPQENYRHCEQICEKQGQGPWKCSQHCETNKILKKEMQQSTRHCEQICQKEGDGPWQCKQHCDSNGQGGNNPYFLGTENFQERFRSQHGHILLSPRFSQISNLLRGIENYRVAFIEANPSTLMIPHHFDAESVFFVIRGRGTVNFVQQKKKESYNLEQGDVIRVPAGSLVYLINRDDNDKFQAAALFQPIDRFRAFFAVGVGGKDSGPIFDVLSDKILETAFNIPKERLEKLLGQQRREVIVKASQQQIRALSHDASSSLHGGSEARGPHNIFNQKPTASNQYGQLYMVDASKYEQLQDLDVEVAYYNISKGSMLARLYDSKATSLVLVIGGIGRLEMACPNLSSTQGQSQEEGGTTHYRRVSARLFPRTAFIIPAGHPVSIVASDNQNLQILAYKLNAVNNQRNYLAGQDNVLNQLEREAKELSFSMPATKVDAVLNNRKQSVFLPGPSQHGQQEPKRQGRHSGFLVEALEDGMVV